MFFLEAVLIVQEFADAQLQLKREYLTIPKFSLRNIRRTESFGIFFVEK